MASYKIVLGGFIEDHRNELGNRSNPIGPDHIVYHHNGLKKFEEWHLNPVLSYYGYEDRFYIYTMPYDNMTEEWMDGVKARMPEKRFQQLLKQIEKGDT